MIPRNLWLGEHFSGRLGIQQRVLPSYRTDFFDMLSSACDGGLNVFAGSALPQESISTAETLKIAQYSYGRNLHFFYPESQFYLLWQTGLINWLKKWNPDALIIEGNPRYLSTNLAIKWMHSRRRPVLGWGLGAVSYSGPMTGLLTRLRRLYFNSIDGIIAYSHKGAEQYRLQGVPATRIFVAQNAVVARPTQLPPERPVDFDGKPKVIFVGRLQSRKRIDCLLKACATIPKEKQPCLWIVGDGPDREKLETLAAEIYPQTEFKGAIQSEGLSKLLNAADLFILPGTGGLAVQEAMAQALPVIVGRGDGTQEDLVKGIGEQGEKNGWFVPSDDVGSLAEILNIALSDVKRLRRMGAESFRIVREEINIDSMVRVFVQALNSLESSEHHLGVRYEL